MSDKFTLGENGKIADNDALYESLDKYYDNDEYSRIIDAVLAVPEEQRSVKLRFRLISAYNNIKEFDKARNELEKIFPMCKTPAEQSKFHYMFGYINFMQDKEMTARACYEEGLAIDPEDTGELDLADEIAECNNFIKKDLEMLGELSGRMCRDIDTRCAEKSKKLELSKEEFTMYLGFLPGVRKTPGFDRPLLFEKFFTVYKGDEREKEKKWLADYFGITDRDSFIRFYRSGRVCNIARMGADVTAYLSGNPNFDVKELDKNGKRSFNNTVEFIGAFNKHMPESGILAWDISEKIGFCRHAYACGLITNNDYCSSMLYLREAAIKGFDSLQDYIKSLILGSGVYMFTADSWSIKSAANFMRQMIVLILNGDLPDIKWG